MVSVVANKNKIELYNVLITYTDTVENVLEPEESDVCLIPDDPETEVTEAEKELARENAEKAAEEEEAAEQTQSGSKSPVNEAEAGTEAQSDKVDAAASTVNPQTEDTSESANGNKIS